MALPYGSFDTADGSILLSVQNEREWRTFCVGVLLTPELADDSRFLTNANRVQHRALLDQLVTDCVAGLTTEQARSRLDAAGIAYARPQLATRVW